MEIRVGFGGSVVVKDPKQTRIASVSKDHGTSWVQPVNLGDLLPLTKVKVSELFKSSANVIGFDDYGENPSEFEWYIVSSQQDSSSRAYKQMHLCKPLAFHSDAEETLKSSLTPVFTSGRQANVIMVVAIPSDVDTKSKTVGGSKSCKDSVVRTTLCSIKQQVLSKMNGKINQSTIFFPWLDRFRFTSRDAVETLFAATFVVGKCGVAQ